MSRSLRRRLDRLELAREPGHSTGDYLAEVLEEFVETADPDACARALELFDRVAAERGDTEITAAAAAVEPASDPYPEAALASEAPPPLRRDEGGPPLQPLTLPEPGLDPTATPSTDAADQRAPDPPQQKPVRRSSLPPYLQWQLVINKPPPGPRPPPPGPYRDPLDDPLGLYE